MPGEKKSKKAKVKPPQGHPAATSVISQPAVTDSPNHTLRSSFSSRGTHFAFLSLAIDKHRLRIYDSISGQSIAEHVFDLARVTSMIWAGVNLSEGQADSEDLILPPSKKKRKKRESTANETNPEPSTTEVVALGLSDGTVSFFSPSHSRVIRTLSHSSSATPILSLAIAESADLSPMLWTSGADGSVHLWDVRKNNIIGSWKTSNRIPYSSMAFRPGSFSEEDGRIELLAANHSVQLLSAILPSSSSELEFKKPKKTFTFIGHASSIPCLRWDASQTPSKRFFSMAERDRFVYVWELPKSQSEGKIVASVPLDADCRAFALSASQKPHPSGKQTLVTLSASEKISIFPVPAELTPPTSSTNSAQKIPTLTPCSNISISSRKSAASTAVIDAVFDPESEGSVRIARVVGGIRPVFDVVRYLDDNGGYVRDVNVVRDPPEASAPLPGAPNKRYSEGTSLTVQSGTELGQDQEMDDLTSKALEGDLDVDLAEMSLGQRLTALTGTNGASNSDGSDFDSEDNHTDSGVSPSKRKAETGAGEKQLVVPASSLTRTLIQALHSSDSGLIETCLAHSDRQLIWNTVKRLPPQLGVPLIASCTERLGRGGRSGRMKGGGGGASAQRGTALVAWIKAVLTIHSGHLMTIPDLVVRLSGLYATLTARLALQDSLLSLNGRLDLVLSQIEMRSSNAPAPLSTQKAGKQRAKAREKATEGRKYVEGESEEEHEMAIDVEMGSGDEGSVEDVQLGGESEEEEEEAEETDGEGEGDEGDADADDSDEAGGPKINGFIDEEAEEYSGDSEEEDESE